MKTKGRAWKFGDNVDTDFIIPARFLNVSDRQELAKNCFADQRPEFYKEVNEGDILIGGRNFGCGSSREHAPLAIKEAGVRIIIAKSVARIFYRNSFNIGLPVLESEDAVDAIEDGDQVSADMSTGEIINISKGKSFLAKPIPEFMRMIIETGGLVEYIKKNE